VILWVKAAHIVSVTAWMAGLLYLPRLMVYHCDAAIGSVQSETFKTMERRLLKAIATPAMVSTWLFGIWLAIAFQAWNEAWFIAKFVLVSGLTFYHHLAVGWVRAFAEDRNERSARYYRIMNEVPAGLMVLIVILVVVRPF